LFAPEVVPNLEVARLANRSLMEAIFRLAWLREPSGLVPVNWRDMETEELGSVYESLLELTPRLTDDGRGLTFAEGGEAKGHARKTSGSYYTPDSLVQALLDSALDPVLHRIEAEADDPAAALLTITVLDPACGSGHFLLAAARRIAARLARARSGGIAAPADYRRALRDVARTCIHGVDRNPMAVELTKVALWIETVEPGKPLGFLDTNIRCGDSLFGVFDLKALEEGVPEDAYKPLSGDDKETAKHFAKRNRAERTGQGSFDFGGAGGRLPAAAPIAGEAKALRAMPEDNPEEIAAKRERFEIARADPHRWNLRIAADLYVAAFLAPKIGGVPSNHTMVQIPTTAHVWDALAGRTLQGPLIERAQELAGAARAFHWPLEFPDVMAAGGFDAVLGNPPWERITLQEQEFFASRAPEIADAPNAAARGKLIAKLKEATAGTRERALYDEFEAAKRAAEASSVFAHVDGEQAGRFPLTGRGDVNTYALFAELFARVAGSKGRAGVIVPTGIATDATTAPFFEWLVGERRLVRLIDFENRDLIFPEVYYRTKFCLMTLGQNVDVASFAFFLTNTTQLSEPERNFTLTPAAIAGINPNTKTAPVFRARADSDVTAKIYTRIPVLINDAKGASGNPWGVTFSRLFDMSNDSGLFRTAAQLSQNGFTHQGTEWVKGTHPHQGTTASGAHGREIHAVDVEGDSSHNEMRYVPLYEAKMVSMFDHRAASYGRRCGDRGFRVLPETSLEQYLDFNYEPEPYYYIEGALLEERLAGKTRKNWLVGLKDITSTTNERTAIFAAIPKVAVGHTMPVIFSTAPNRHYVALYASLNSLVLDYVAKLKVAGIHLTYSYLKQLPVLPPESYSEEDLNFIVPRVLELTYTSHSMAAFARDLGFNGSPFAWDEDGRAQLRADLDAWYARAYGLTRDELRYILDPADVKGADYPSETFRVLKANEIRRFGEYRTARLVLRAWDRQELGKTKT
jgi:N-6 DNA Methylase